MMLGHQVLNSLHCFKLVGIMAFQSRHPRLEWHTSLPTSKLLESMQLPLPPGPTGIGWKLSKASFWFDTLMLYCCFFCTTNAHWLIGWCSIISQQLCQPSFKQWMNNEWMLGGWPWTASSNDSSFTVVTAGKLSLPSCIVKLKCYFLSNGDHHSTM